MSDKSLALLGGPDSGKTTYLGALTLDLTFAGKTAPLRLDSIGKDAAGLRRLAELQKGKYPQRTKEERHTLDLSLRTTGELLPKMAFKLRVADYDGEEIERLFHDRTGPTMNEWQLRATADGLLLFVRPEALKPLPELHRPVVAVPASAQSGPLFRPEQAGDAVMAEEFPEPRPLSSNEPVRVPTLLALVELLQYLRDLRGLSPGERPAIGQFRIALLLPSWDAVAPKWQQRTPSDYLVEHAPLLMDYLWSNHHLDDVFCFGLSATGGDLLQPEYQARYKKRPGGYVHYARTASQIEERRDLFLPILWALFGDQAFHLG